jgi:hypothetical protein
VTGRAARRRRPRGLPLILAAVVVVAAVLLTLKLTGRGAAQPCPAAARAQSTFVPAFFEPPDWSRAVAGGRAPAVMILNPASGPGPAPEPGLQAAVRQARAAGSRVIGYIGTKYGQLPAAQVRQEVRAYRAWYHVTGIFLDQTPPDGRRQLPYYRAQASFIRQAVPGGVIWMNPGAFPDPAYLSVADVLMVFEGSYASYQHLTTPRWVARYPASRFAHTVYATPAADVTSGVRLARDRNAEYVFLTPLTGPNPYGALPAYWPAEQAAAASSCQTTPK